jgi:hypothetical protein
MKKSGVTHVIEVDERVSNAAPVSDSSQEVGQNGNALAVVGEVWKKLALWGCEAD